MSIVGIFALCRVSVKEKEKPVVQKNTVCLLCGNAGNDNFFFFTNTNRLFITLGKLSSVSSVCFNTQTTEVFVGLKITF